MFLLRLGIKGKKENVRGCAPIGKAVNSPKAKKRIALSGFTLPEMLVSLALFCLVAGGILGVLILGNRYWHIGTDYVYLQQQARLAVDKMSNELVLSNSDNAYGKILIGDHVSQGQAAGGGYSITFKVPTPVKYKTFDNLDVYSYYDNLGNINWGPGVQLELPSGLAYKIKYCVENGKLVRKIVDAAGNPAPVEIEGFAPVILANDISEVIFIGQLNEAEYGFNNAPLVQVRVTASKTNAFTGNLSHTLISQVYLRN